MKTVLMMIESLLPNTRPSRSRSIPLLAVTLLPGDNYTVASNILPHAAQCSLHTPRRLQFRSTLSPLLPRV